MAHAFGPIDARRYDATVFASNRPTRRIEKMSYEIHMFSAVAESAAVQGVAAGEHHPMLIFLRQRPGDSHDLAAAAASAQALGWVEVDITRAGTLPPDAGDAMDETVLAAYRGAVESGAGIKVFDAVVRPAPRKA